jgi:anti-anti-sigma factor
MTGMLNQPDHSELLLRVSREGAVVHVAGEVDLVTAPRLADELTKAESAVSPPETVVVDLTEVSFLASAGLRVLLEHDERCRESGRELCVVAGNSSVARSISVTGLTEVLTVRDSLDQALLATQS